MKFKTNLKIKSNIIDPLPFVNVMVLFIVFFILATGFTGRPGFVLDLPQVEQAELYNADSVVVSLVEEKVFLEDREIGIDKLQEELAKLNPQLLAIKAGRDIRHSRVTEIIGIARKLDIRQVAIATETGEK